MKRLNSNFTVSKLGESVFDDPFKALTMKNQVDEDEQRILHYSYNLAVETEHKRHSYFSTGLADRYGELTRNNPLFRSERMINELSQGEKMQRSNSIAVSGRHDMLDGKAEKNSERPKAKNMFFYAGTTPGYVEKSTPAVFSTKTITENPVTANNGSRGEARSRKLGLGETENRGLMCHKLRKKAVCDSSDNSHYQRQFLRVVNKRF